jgi:pyruvate/2-oxoglutarate dehydrogenase complex dihydrolipoamide acyltransferase (E2) component
MSQEKSRSLSFGERWIRDSLMVIRPVYSVIDATVDMTAALEKLDQYRKAGVGASAVHLLIQAVARALASNSNLHQIVIGNKRIHPDRVDIALSVSGDHFISPLLLIEGADQKSIEALVEETTRRAPEAREKDRQFWTFLDRFGWLIPFGWLRRLVFRWVFEQAFFRKGAGSFQVSMVPAEAAFSGTFVSTGVLVGGAILPDVIVYKGQPAVRSVMKLKVSVDHGVWSGQDAVRFLATVKASLES